MIKIMIIGIGICWFIAFIGPVLIKAYHNHKKKGDNCEK